MTGFEWAMMIVMVVCVLVVVGVVVKMVIAESREPKRLMNGRGKGLPVSKEELEDNGSKPAEYYYAVRDERDSELQKHPTSVFGKNVVEEEKREREIDGLVQHFSLDSVARRVKKKKRDNE